MPEKTLRQIICDQVVNDYFTPNIKAEVILDTLLTPYSTQIVQGQPDISVQGNVLNGINSSVSLKASVSGLRDTKDELAQLLADIINEIY